jgi:hypothetical protein
VTRFLYSDLAEILAGAFIWGAIVALLIGPVMS